MGAGAGDRLSRMTRRATPDDVARYFDRHIDCCGRRSKVEQRIWNKASDLLRSTIEGAVQGRTVLELGCGEGALLRNLIRAGAIRGTGVDLSPSSVASSDARAREEGLADKVRFEAGDGATARLERHDVVVLDKVVCCYAGFEELLRNASSAARATVAFTLPRTDGPWFAGTSLILRMGNLLEWVRRRGFRAYVHDERKVHRVMAEAGFELQQRKTASMWALRVYIPVGATGEPTNEA